MTAARLHVQTTTLSIRWGDMDAIGHVNNTVYFRYMEQARIDWLYAQAKHPGFDATKGPVIVNASCNFLVPIKFPARIEVRMYLGSPGRTSMHSYFEIAAGDTKHAEGAAKVVWIEYASGRPTPLPDSVAAPLRALAGEKP